MFKLKARTLLITTGAVLGFLTLAFAPPLAAQTDLFLSVGPNAVSGDPPPGIEAIYPIEPNFGGLATAPAQLTVKLGDLGDIVADLRAFEAIEGFDAPGVPSEGSTIEDLRYVWRGQSDGFDVIVSVAYGWINATITGYDGDYSIQQQADLGTGLLASTNLVRLGEMPLEEEPPMEAPPGLASPEGVLRKDDFPLVASPPRPILEPLPQKAVGEVQEIKLLIVYERQALIDAQQAVTTIPPQAALSTVIDDAVAEFNQAAENSGMNVRLKLRAVIELPSSGPSAYEPSGTGYEIRNNLQIRTDIQQWKDEVEADIVSVFLRDGLALCGAAFVQRPGCGDFAPIGTCDPGESFEPYALNWVSVECARDWKSFSHETGHNFGLEHAFDNVQPDGFTREQALFPDAFGCYYSDGVGGGFRTMMATSPRSLVRLLHFANPYVVYNGVPTGILHDCFNVRAANYTTPVMIGFGGGLGAVIFCADMEAGDLDDWDEVTP